MFTRKKRMISSMISHGRRLKKKQRWTTQWTDSAGADSKSIDKHECCEHRIKRPCYRWPRQPTVDRGGGGEGRGGERRGGCLFVGDVATAEWVSSSFQPFSMQHKQKTGQKERLFLMISVNPTAKKGRWLATAADCMSYIPRRSRSGGATRVAPLGSPICAAPTPASPPRS